MARKANRSDRPAVKHPPAWIAPQLTRLVDEAPDGPDWLHEIKYDGYRIHARIDGDDIRLLTRTGLDWSHRYQATVSALRAPSVESAYLDGELCAVRPDGVTSFSRLQAAMDEGRTGDLVLFAFDLLFLNGNDTAKLPLIDRKARLEAVLSKTTPGLHFGEHVVGNGPRFREHACRMGLEGAISKRSDRPYASADRGLWVKSKCLNREEFVVVGWTDPTGSRPHIGALLLAYYIPVD
jgi:DNA ligase D-like protein (predicted ligase)